MIGYCALAQQMEEQEANVMEDMKEEKVEMSHALMERCVMLYRKPQLHQRCAVEDGGSIQVKILLYKA
jgi:phage pi2 protein 07